MSKTQFVKWTTLIGAIISGIAVAVSGDLITGAGIIAASVSSLNLN